jgi:hypothetical protein
VLIDAALRFPTVVFTIGLGIILIYWAFVLLGALDIDLFGDADVSGAGKGLGEVLGHGSHGLGDGGLGDGGLGDGVAGHDVGDAHGGDGHDAHGHATTGGVWSGLGLNKVPITISVSVIFLVCWCLSLLGMTYGSQLLGGSPWVPGGILVATLVIGLPLAGLLVRPLAGVFELREGKSNHDYIGHTCTITTGSVNDTFGQATVEDGGTVLQIPVRCDRSDVLARGHKALIIDFDTAREAYVVEPAADMLPAPQSSDATT